MADLVCWVPRHDRLRSFFLFVPSLQSYDVEVAYARAKAQRDGELSPHTAFRTLNPNDDSAAAGFVNQFGPLELWDESEPRQLLRQQDLVDLGEEVPYEEGVPKERCVWVDVEDFWDKHKRFVSIAKLWEARENYPEMVTALSEVALRAPSLGDPFPWEPGKHRQWIRTANAKRLREMSSTIIKHELNLQANEMQVRWTCADPSSFTFQLAPHAKSLWMAIWHLFARDTAAGAGWRICPHCSRLFYPKRKDSYFCESKYQKLHAANRWWEENSAEELEKRRRERAKSGPKFTKKLADGQVRRRG